MTGTGHGIVQCECGQTVRWLCNCCRVLVAETVSSCAHCKNRLLPKKELAKLAQELADKLKRPA